MYFLEQLISGENFKVLQVVRTVEENTACVITGNFALSFFTQISEHSCAYFRRH